MYSVFSNSNPVLNSDPVHELDVTLRAWFALYHFPCLAKGICFQGFDLSPFPLCYWQCVISCWCSNTQYVGCPTHEYLYALIDPEAVWAVRDKVTLVFLCTFVSPSVWLLVCVLTQNLNSCLFHPVVLILGTRDRCLLLLPFSPWTVQTQLVWSLEWCQTFCWSQGSFM